MTAAGPVRVVVADDHPERRRGLCATLCGADGVDVVAAVGDADHAVAVARELAPDVVLVDLADPGTDGRSACQAITRALPDTAVLVLTRHDDVRSLSVALRAGARGYLPSGADQPTITRALASVSAGGLHLGGAAARDLLTSFTVPPGAASARLSSREREVLDLLVRGRSNADIARALSLAPKTVRNHVSTVLAKIGAQDRAHAAELARRAGFGGRG